MHDWSEESFDWQGLNDAGYFISDWLEKWARLPIFQVKEKFGTLRIYCSMGLGSFYSIWRPRYMWVPTWYPWKLDLTISQWVMPVINKIVVPIQKKLYVHRYRQAVLKWPHLKVEILVDADYGELLNGIEGFKYKDYWTEVK